MPTTSPEDTKPQLADSAETTADSVSMGPLVVGIGISSGGLESLASLLANVPRSQQMAYVVVQHQPLDYPGNVQEFLARHCALPVECAADGTVLKPSHVYLLPHTSFCLENGTLTARQNLYSALQHPVDDFLVSLAEEQREKSIAVVLAGTGTDGIRGIKSIKSMGGLTIAQSLDSARFVGETQCSIISRLCDLELSPGMISVEIANYIRNIDNMNPTGPAACEDELLGQIYSILKKVSFIDFTYYKKLTVRRRISRRMALFHMDSLRVYVAYLLDNEDEARALAKDLLIGVTGFFRDRTCFEALKSQVIAPLLLKATGDEAIRVWVAGCSTGEEAYSVAILFDECMHELDRWHPVEIFATDIDPDAIKTASRGVYHESIEADVSSERLNRYFAHKGDHYTVCKSIRRMCIFAPHNLFLNPPFRSLDLITYRNVLIYLQPILQNVIFSAFNNVLKPGGFLFLGKSESVGEHGDVFSPVSLPDKIFCHTPSGRKSVSAHTAVLPPSVAPGLHHLHTRLLTERNTSLSMEEALPQLFDVLGLTCVIVSDTDDVEHLSGDFHPFLKLPRGTASRNIFNLLTPDLALAVTTVMRNARCEVQPVTRTGVRLASGKTCSITAMPLKTRRSNPTPLLALLFVPEENTHRPITNAEPYNADEAAARRIAELEQEVRDLRTELDENIAELKTANDELQSSNEDIHTSNEELQTSNEELQSVNEELYIVNSEYQLKVAELMELNDDMSNFLNSTMIGLLLVDNNLNIRKFTDYVGQEFGIMEHDIGRSMLLVMQSFSNIDLGKITHRVLQTATPLQCEAMSAAGKHYMLRVSPYRTIQGTVNGLVISIVDIEELKGAYSQIEKLSYAIEQMPNIVVLTDPDGLVEYVNPRFSDITGYSPEEMRGRPLRDCLPASITDAEYTAIWDMVQHQETWTAELECCRKNGEMYWERVSLQPVVNKSGRITNYLKLGEDITTQKLTQLSDAEYRQHLEKMVSLRTADLEESRNEAQAASNAKSAFLSTMSHEIRTPMNAIIGFTHIFNRANLTPGQLDHLDKIQLSANTLLGIINDVLDISKIESGKFELSPTVFDLRKSLDTVRSIVDASAAAKQLSLCVSVQENVPATLEGDVLRINQILLNLLNNAIKFTERGEVRLNVSLSRAPCPESPDVELTFTVEDSGIGISEEQLPRIFQSFVQADNTISRKYGGTGLGLSICRQLVERMGGQISVRSTLGQGSCFRFTLVLGTVQNAEQLESTAPETAAVSDESALLRLRGRTVLVVEDNEINQEIACALLEEYGLRLHRARNGQEAVGMAATTRYDSILMDVQMPVMDGLEATRHLREMGTRPDTQWLADIPIIAMTANVMAEDRQQCLGAGMNDHIAKPIEPTALRQMLIKWIAGETSPCPSAAA